MRRYGGPGAAKPHYGARGAGGGDVGTPLPPLFLLQGCRIYLCGTKSDLLEEDRRKRGIDFHDVQDYADGTASAGPSWAHAALSGWGVRED